MGISTKKVGVYMYFRVIKENPERAYNAELERQKCKRKKLNKKLHFSYCTKIGKSCRPPVRNKPMGWEPDSWKDF